MGDGWPLVWGATSDEVTAGYPCDEVFAAPKFEAHRAISVAAPRAHVFRWLCQLKAAPYSYDLLNNLGRPSPRTLTPGLEQLKLGQRFITVFALISYVVDEHVTIRVGWLGRLMFGELAISYVVHDEGPGGSRLAVKLTLPRKRHLGLLRQWVLAWLDLFMMRRQLLNLRDLAERSR
ncbi:hypothetical protein UK23_32815 [Lentzea aerocolonigenes]|uniref:Polyketide cyclase n=1 Tax=Lentzea aerocolonigenes TaxID=68170 RepID=A0A0F0GQ49_LENAE|nr:hypothetical protein UK23_32815 [Lentzea aerocolonigenes]